MRGLPEAVAGYLRSLDAGEATAAFLEVDAAGMVTARGGDLKAFGLAAVREGRPAAEQVDCLYGVLPVGARGLRLSWVQLASGTFADVHLFRRGERVDLGGWAVFVDARAAAERRRETQQEANDLALLRVGIEKLQSPVAGAVAEGDGAVLLLLPTLLDVVVLEYCSGGKARVLGATPPWFDRLWADGQPALGALTERFPFLEPFLGEAEAFWGWPEGRATPPAPARSRRRARRFGGAPETLRVLA